MESAQERTPYGDTLAAVKARLCAWDEEESLDDTEDMLHYYFELYGRWEWIELNDKARELYNAMFESEVEEGSPIDGLFAALAAAAARGMCAAIAAMLGISAEGLEMVASYWYEVQDTPPAPLTWDELQHRIQQYLAEREDDASSDHRPTS